MEDIHSISTTILKEISSPLTTNPQQQIINSTAPLIQQSDVSSSRPALLAHDALGPLLFEVRSRDFHWDLVEICQGKGNLSWWTNVLSTFPFFSFVLCFAVLKERRWQRQRRKKLLYNTGCVRTRTRSIYIQKYYERPEQETKEKEKKKKWSTRLVVISFLVFFFFSFFLCFSLMC